MWRAAGHGIVVIAWPLAVWAGFACGPARAQLRILDYNVGASDPASPGPRPNMGAVLQAINAQTRAGFARPIDIFTMQEGENTATTGQAFADLLNAITGGTSYVPSSLNGGSTGSGRPMAVYNSATITLISQALVGVISSTGQPRQTLRYQFRPVGYDSTADFYVYNSHFKAVDDSSSAARRAVEAQAIRTNSDALGSNVNLIYAGDLNLYAASETAFQTLTAPGNGQAFDPIDQIGTWSDNSAFKAYQTQSPATTEAYPGQVTAGMDDRFDFQLVSGEWLDGRGLDYIAGSYWAFGNTGTHRMNAAITTGSAAALQAFLPGYTVAQSGTILTYLSQVADHLPVVADYQLPARMSASLATLPAKVIVGAAVSGTLTVSNSAPVGVSQGADRLDYGYSSSGLLSGSGTGSDVALGAANNHLLAVRTGTAGSISGTVSAQASSPQAGSPTFSQVATMSVVDHAIGSFASGSTLTTLDLDFGTLTQGTGTTARNFSIFNRSGPLGAAWTARLDLDALTPSVPANIFSTTLAPFTNLASGSSRAFGASMFTTTTGSFQGTYSLSLSDEDLPGATTQSLALTVRGRVVSPATVVLNVASGTQTQSALGYAGITGTSSIVKRGNGTILLNEINTFTGTTSIDQGSAVLGAAGAISTSALVKLATGASLDVRGLSAGYTVGSGQTLGGAGSVLGSVTFGRGSTLSPGLLDTAVGLGALAAGIEVGAIEARVVPEPGTLRLLGVGLGAIGLGIARRRRPLVRLFAWPRSSVTGR